MQDTYSYIARSAEDPSKVAIFTLYDHSMTIEPGTTVEAVEKEAAERAEAVTGKEVEAAPRPRTRRLPWYMPVLSLLLGDGARVFRVADTRARAQNGGLAVTAWLRAGGLRLLPVTFYWEHVDNRDMAQSFVDELQRRKMTTPRQGVARGPLDVWATWLAVGLALGVGLYTWLRRES
ncbi:MAG: hypothetical protein GX552_14345 [Chloroflexi bacterium]|jgi:hypothetical protein|nr:hypothetical protein [Chloroflexota bacterium]